MFLLWLRQLPRCGDQTPASVSPPAEGRSSPTNTPVFPPVPSSYGVLHGSICSFTLVRYSCRLSGGVLHALLCLKYIPDVSVDRDVLHIHLLLRHLVLQNSNCYISILFSRTFLLFFKGKFFKGNFFEKFYKYLFITWHHKSTYGFNIKLQKYRIQWNHHLDPFYILLKHGGYSSWGESTRLSTHTHGSTWLLF